MPPLAYFGIESSGLNLVIDLLILFVVVLYFSLIYWTYADARRRILDPMLVGCATAASLFPFVGTIVYVILRPPEYLEDVRERELEMRAAEARLHELDSWLCPHCDYRIERDFVRCPSCLRKLKERCVNCSAPARPGVDDLPLLRDRGARRRPPTRRKRRRRANRRGSLSSEASRARGCERRGPVDVRGDARGSEPRTTRRSTGPPSRSAALRRLTTDRAAPTPACNARWARDPSCRCAVGGVTQLRRRAGRPRRRS